MACFGHALAAARIFTTDVTVTLYCKEKRTNSYVWSIYLHNRRTGEFIVAFSSSTFAEVTEYMKREGYI